jgi:hypothetical protein
MGKRKNTTTSEVNLPEWIDNPARAQAGQIGQHAEWLRQNPYQGDWMASIDPDQILGNRWTGQTADKLRFGGGGEALYDLGTATARGDFLDLENNPYFQNYLETGVLDPIRQTYSERIRPMAESGAVGRNAFDNLSYALEKAQLTEDEATLIGRAGAETSLPMYQFEREQQAGAGDILNAATAQMLLPGAIKSQAGAGARDLEQARIDTELANRMGPISEAERILMSLLYPTQAYAGQSVTAPGINRGASTAQGAIGGASAGAQAGSLMSSSPYGAIIGALLGGVGGGLGGYYS